MHVGEVHSGIEEGEGRGKRLTWSSVFSSAAQLHHFLRNPDERCQMPPAWPWTALGIE